MGWRCEEEKLTFVARSLPFGGVGESGWGSYHGWEGFKTFSHEKGQSPRPFSAVVRDLSELT